MTANIHRLTLEFLGILTRARKPAVELNTLSLVCASVHIGYTEMYLRAEF
jgi:hypothetical protein